MAQKKAGGATKNGRDSKPKRLGIKVFSGSYVGAGSIIVRQRGLKFWYGPNVGVGRDHTLYALSSGTVLYYSKNQKRIVRINRSVGL